jgi:hypothetical protein
MQPGIAQQLEEFLAQAVWPTRKGRPQPPEAAVYHVLKTYEVVQHQWTPRCLGEAPSERVKLRREELSAWLKSTAARAKPLVRRALAEVAEDLFMHIETEDVLHALDVLLDDETERQRLLEMHPPMQTDLRGLVQEMSGPLRPVPHDVGATEHIVVDPQGRLLAVDEDKQYSFWGRVTRQPLVEMQLTGQPGAYLLARRIYWGNEGEQRRPYRPEVAFGSRAAKGGQVRWKDKLEGKKKGANYLPLVPLTDTAPGAPLYEFFKRLAPQREDGQRLQRSLMERVPHDMVAEGLLRTRWLSDVTVGQDHAFQVKNADGRRIALRPHDGCGLIRFDKAIVIPAVREAVTAWYAVNRRGLSVQQQAAMERHLGPVAGAPTAEQVKLAQPVGQEPALLAPQATQYPERDDAVLSEVKQRLEELLQLRVAEHRELPMEEVRRAWQVYDAAQAAQGGTGARAAQPVPEPPKLKPEELDNEELYSLMVSGPYRGLKVRLVPSGDDCFHVPRQKSRQWDAVGGAMALGRPPYEKPNLAIVPPERVKTAKQGDITAEVLGDGAFVLQYSLSAFDTDGAGLAVDTVVAKGQMIVLMPNLAGEWPAADADVVLSREDMKMWSQWIERRDRSRIPDRQSLASNLRIKQILPPGSAVAAPPEVIKDLAGDFDGDDGFLYVDAPALIEHYGRYLAGYEQRQAGAAPVKIPKTSTSAFDERGRYSVTRLPEIMRLYQGHKMLGEASNLMFRLNAQPKDVAQKVSLQLMFGTFDGLDGSLKTGVLEALAAPEAARAALPQLLAQAQQGVAWAHLPEARQHAQVLLQQLKGWQEELDGAALASAAEDLPDELAERFPNLEAAFLRAQDRSARIQALLTNYPVCRFSRDDFPNGPPGYVEGEPVLSMLNLLGNASKAGTDAPKVDTHVDAYAFALEKFLRVLHADPRAVTWVPYLKQLAALLHEGRFDAGQALRELQRNPSLAAGIMETAIHALVKYGAVPPPRTPAQRISADPQQLLAEAQKLRADAVQREPRITAILKDVAAKTGMVLNTDHKLKSVHSLQDKLARTMVVNGVTLEQASANVNDALRYSMIHSADPQEAALMVQRYYQCLAQLEQQGLRKVKVRNFFAASRVDFSGLNVSFKDSAGQLLEIQFHTSSRVAEDGKPIPGTFELKEKFHDDYKKSWNMLMQGRSLRERRQVMAEARKAFGALQMPPGIEEVEDWPPKLPAQAHSTSSLKRQPAQEASTPGLAAQARHNPHVQKLMENARAAELIATPILRPVVEACGGRFAGTDSATGTDGWRARLLKKPRSILEKMLRLQQHHGLDEQQASERVNDALRYEIEFDDPGKVYETASEVLKAFAANGTELTGYRDGFAELARYRQSGLGHSAEAWGFDKAPYAGLNLKMRAADGTRFQVQLHTKHSQLVHNKNRRLYEQWRNLPTLATADPRAGEAADKKRRELVQQMYVKTQEVALPPHASDAGETRFEEMIARAKRS